MTNYNFGIFYRRPFAVADKKTGQCTAGPAYVETGINYVEK